MFQQWHTSIENSGTEGKEGGGGGGVGGEAGPCELCIMSSDSASTPILTPLVSAPYLKVLQVWSNLCTTVNITINMMPVMRPFTKVAKVYGSMLWHCAVLTVNDFVWC